MASPKPPRNRDLAAIHAGAKALGMDDDTYRAMLWTQARVRSAKDLDFAGRRRVLDHLRDLGAPGAPANEWAWVDSAAANKRPLLRKIIVMCRQLGLAKGGQIRYCEGIARRQHQVDRKLQMMDQTDLWRIVCALERTHDHKRYVAPDAPVPEGGVTPEGKPA